MAYIERAIAPILKKVCAGKRREPMLALLSGDDVLLGDWDRDALLQSYVTDSEAFTKKKQAYHLYD